MHLRRARHRFRGRRGISPIIAMILLVAIVVVLAAVLYVMVSGFGRTSVATPLGTALYAGPASQSMGTNPPNADYCQNKHFCYEIPIQEASPGLTLGDLAFKVVTSTGTVHEVSGGNARISVVTGTSSLLAYSQVKSGSPLVVTSWTKLYAGTTSSTPITTLQTIWVQFGNEKTSPFGQSYSLDILGVGAYSGTVTVALP